MRRMDRYREEETKISRTDKNKELYQNVSNNVVYTNITDVTNTNAFEINNPSDTNSSHTTRTNYQRMKQYQQPENIPHNKKELEDFNHLYQKDENKIYDINSVLEAARKNRKVKDEKDEKRKLKNNAYNILAGMNREELEKYREEKKKRIMTPEEEEIRELIDTIASKTLAGEIDKATTVDLLSDLMATNLLDTVEGMAKPEEDSNNETEQKENEEIKEEIENNEPEERKAEEQEETEEEKPESKKQIKEEIKESIEKKDNDFYTKSMDLSDKDFELSNEFKEKKLPLPIRILIFLIVIAVILVAAYFIYQRII